jgi:hypothetical protein
VRGRREPSATSVRNRNLRAACGVRLRACRTLGKHSNYTTTLFIENGYDSLPDVVMRNLNPDLRQ